MCSTPWGAHTALVWLPATIAGAPRAGESPTKTPVLQRRTELSLRRRHLARQLLCGRCQPQPSGLLVCLAPPKNPAVTRARTAGETPTGEDADLWWRRWWQDDAATVQAATGIEVRLCVGLSLAVVIPIRCLGRRQNSKSPDILHECECMLQGLAKARVGGRKCAQSFSDATRELIDSPSGLIKHSFGQSL